MLPCKYPNSVAIPITSIIGLFFRLISRTHSPNTFFLIAEMLVNS
ncbi:hypothetical protein N0824_03759 [Microcystis sp. 0824]|nr:hypothetical protein N0824_03759 [Microcystis sp. 0824]